MLTTVFVELIVILVSLKSIEIAKGVNRMKAKFFGVNVICTNAIPKEIRIIAANVLNFLAIC